MSKKSSGAEKKKTAFVCAGVVGGPIFHVESVTSNEDDAVLHLLNVGVKWANQAGVKTKRASLFRKDAAFGPKESPEDHNQTPLQAFTFLHGVVAEAISQTSKTPACSSSSTSDSEILKSLSKDEREYYGTLCASAKQDALDAMRALREHISLTTPLRFRVLESFLPMDIKRRILQKLDRQQDCASSGDTIKYATWIDSLLSVPLCRLIVPQLVPADILHATLKNAMTYLDSVVYGHLAAKQAMIERLYMWLKHPYVPQRPLALKGCPGNGKTSLVREGLAVIMNRPFNFVALGGSFDSSFLVGHSYTYEGSTQGRIADTLVSSSCMNPILFFDELDKCSASVKGEEIINVLVHITDTTQSSHFRDRYLNGLDLDLSRSLIVFAFNDASKVSPVLLDRFQVIHTDVFTAAAQGLILKTYLLPRILSEHNLPTEFLTLSEDAIKEASTHLMNGGVRDVRSVLEQVVCKACILQETGGDLSLLSPLKKGDLREVAPGCYELMRGIGAMLLEGRKGVDSSPPLGMYA